MRAVPPSVVVPGVMPIGVIPTVPAPIRPVPGIVPAVVPGVVISCSPAEVEPPTSATDRQSQVNGRAIGDVYGRGIPDYGPNVFRIVPQDERGIKFDVGVGRKPPVAAVGGINIPIRIECQVHGDVRAVGEVTEAVGVGVDELLDFIQVAAVPFISVHPIAGVLIDDFVCLAVFRQAAFRFVGYFRYTEIVYLSGIGVDYFFFFRGKYAGGYTAARRPAGDFA